MGTVRYTVIDGEVIAEKRNGVRKLYVPDPLGSTVALLDNTQTQTDTFSYWPYGEDAGRTGNTSTPFRYVGMWGYYQDSTTTYVRARYLYMQKGRWLTQDPLGIDGGDLSLYRYAENDPQNTADPSGLQTNLDDPTKFKCPAGYNPVWITGYGANTGPVHPPGKPERQAQKYDCAVADPDNAEPVCPQGSLVHIRDRTDGKRKGKPRYGKPIELCLVCDTGPDVGHNGSHQLPQIDIYVGGSNKMTDRQQDRRLVRRGYKDGGSWYCYKCLPGKNSKPK